MTLEDIMNRTLITNTTVYLGEGFDRHDNTDILIEGNKIKKIGKKIKVKDAEFVDGSDFFITPGFVNAHFHPSQQLNRALGVGLSHDLQMDLLHATDKIKKPNDKFVTSYIAVLEGLKAGTTCFQSVGSEIDSQVPVYKDMGVRAACVFIPKDIVAEEKKESVRAMVHGTQDAIKK